MPSLEPPDHHHLQAVSGWLELGNPREALTELDRVRASARLHPDVLEARWEVFAAMENWDTCLEAAQELLRQDPARATGWVHQAYALRRAAKGGLEAALQALLPAANKFPDLPLIPYNLSCYCCQLGQQTEARQWLNHALQLAEPLGGRKPLLEMALSDPDLEALWPELGTNRED